MPPTPKRPRNLAHDDRVALQMKLAREAWCLWFAALPPEEQARLRAEKIHEPAEDTSPGGPGSSEDPASWNAASVMAPEEEECTEAEHLEVQEAFARALSWVVQADNLVQAGHRLTAMLKVMRPNLVRGLLFELEMDAARDLAQELSVEEAQSVGQVFGSVLAWLRNGTSLSVFGQRALAMAYVMGLPAIGGMTLQEIGDPLGKTRQAPSRLVGDARDTFSGLRSRVMRPESHRQKCQKSQIQNRRPSHA